MRVYYTTKGAKYKIMQAKFKDWHVISRGAIINVSSLMGDILS